MNFASVTFLFYFLPILIALYYLSPNRTLKNQCLLIGSLLFYAWGEGIFLLLLLGSIVLNHIFVRIIHRSDSKKAALALAIALNLAVLIFFKYAGWLWGVLTGSAEPTLALHLPLGISFFTFQAISMLVDVYRGVKPPDNVMKTGLYISMFPQLIAGPIVRFNEIRDQIDNRQETWDRFSSGMLIFILGLSQKLLLADTLAIPADAAFSARAGQLTVAAAWLGLICFSLQIYYDFAGYSNMAIGLGRFFGFELPRNFEHPYSAKSFREFWQRWHMTLSRWFRDYLYIPLGGSRRGQVLTYRNLLIVFILCGLWHGANITFLLWGLWHGAFLIGERLAAKATTFRLPPFIGIFYVCLFVALGWVLFRAENMTQAMSYYGNLFGINAGAADIPLQGYAVMALTVGLALSWDGWKKLAGFGQKHPALHTALVWSFVGGLYLCCFIMVASQTHKPFLYFRF